MGRVRIVHRQEEQVWTAYKDEPQAGARPSESDVATVSLSDCDELPIITFENSFHSHEGGL